MTEMITGRGHFTGHFQATLSEYRGPDFSKKCFVFPGQGAAYAGMFKQELQSLDILRNRMRIADGLAQEAGLSPLSAYVLDPKQVSPDDFHLIRNLALFSLQVGLFECLIFNNVRPSLVTGHSFGEFAAIVVSGVASFEEMFKVVIARERACPPPGKLGKMIAISASKDQVKEALQGHAYFVSNLNSPTQTVISCQEQDARAILSSLSSRKLAALALDEVPQPYHTPWLEDSAIRFSKEIERIAPSFRAPVIPLLSSVTHEVVDAASFSPKLILKILSRQLIEPMNFVDQIEKARVFGAYSFVEVGPNRSLTRFVEETLAGAPHRATHCSDRIRVEKVSSGSGEGKKISMNQSKVARLFNRALAAVTGYSITEIDVQDRLQEDLGIDSIKKAEIIFKVMESLSGGKDRAHSGINLSELVTTQDILKYFTAHQRQMTAKKDGSVEKTGPSFARHRQGWKEQAVSTLDQAVSPRMEPMLLPIEDILKDRDRSLEKVLEFLRARGSSPQCLILRDGALPRSILDLEYEELLLTHLEPVVDFFRELGLKGSALTARLNLAFVYQEGARSMSFLAPFLRSWMYENPPVFLKTIELQESLTDPQILELTVDEMKDSYHGAVRYQNSVRAVRAFESVSDESEPKLSNDSIIVSLGGMKGIGWESLKVLNERFAPILYISGRTPEDLSEVRHRLEQLRSKNKNVHYFSLDTTSSQALTGFLSRVIEKHGRIDLVLNHVGVEFSRVLKEKTRREVEQELRAKVATTLSLLRFARDTKIERMVHHSSLVGQFGNHGQSVYSLANAIVQNASAAFNSQIRPQASKALLWPAWDRVGMTENQDVYRALAMAGFPMLPKEQGVELLLAELGDKTSEQSVVLEPCFVARHLAGEIDSKGFHLLIDQAGPMSTQIDLSNLTLEKQPFLREHLVRGVPIYSASGILSLFMCLGWTYWGEYPVISDFLVHSFVIAHENRSNYTLQIEARGEKIHVRLVSNIPHAEAVLERPMGAPEMPARPFTATQTLEFPSINTHFLKFGPKFDKIIDHFWLDEAMNMVGEYHRDRVGSYTGLARFDVLQQVFECAFRTASIRFSLEFDPLPLPLPKSVAKIIPCFSKPVTDVLYAQALDFKSDKERCGQSSHIRNSSGEILVELQGLKLITVNGTIEERSEFQLLDEKENPSRLNLGG